MLGQRARTETATAWDAPARSTTCEAKENNSGQGVNRSLRGSAAEAEQHSAIERRRHLDACKTH